MLAPAGGPFLPAPEKQLRHASASLPHAAHVLRLCAQTAFIIQSDQWRNENHLKESDQWRNENHLNEHE